MQNAFSYEDSDIKKPPPAESYSSGRQSSVTREFDTLKSKKVPQSLEIGLFFCQIFIFII